MGYQLTIINSEYVKLVLKDNPAKRYIVVNYYILLYNVVFKKDKGGHTLALSLRQGSLETSFSIKVDSKVLVSNNYVLTKN